MAAIAQRDIVPLLIDGLRSLEYRGYDSAGVATLGCDGLIKERTVGKVEALASRLAATGMSGTMGIGHTRWATHGRPDELNAHPHVSTGMVAVVHNGIIENHESLKATLIEHGYVFESETDTEVIAHRIHFHLQHSSSLLRAVRTTCAELQGAFSIAAMSTGDPEKIVVARSGSPLVIGIGKDENFVASDANALLAVTRQLIYLEEGDVAEITSSAVAVTDSSGQYVTRQAQRSEYSRHDVGKGRYPHYMLKEIFEQSRAVSDALAPALGEEHILGTAFGDSAEALLADIENVQIIACGTSYHAGLIGSYLIEGMAKLPCRVEQASEYRYRDPIVPAKTLCIALSQSGETADTLAAVRFARSKGYAAALSICNVADSSLTRESELSFMTRAGPEIGVASTKSFTTQLAALKCLAIVLARRKMSDPRDEAGLVAALHTLTKAIDEVLQLDDTIRDHSQHLAQFDHALFLGRGAMYPVAMEGALKLKEISYIHAEAYPAGELKHGPLALVDPQMPVIALVPNDSVLGKMRSNLEEVRARDGRLTIFADPNCGLKSDDHCTVITLPKVDSLIAPLIYSIPLQLLAYHVAVARGTNVDQPRNLAKSVTVE
tara:strand:+ start:15873 stop:17690 length:1818 start_codon:yes stop_codon:yes gene_type:complete